MPIPLRSRELFRSVTTGPFDKTKPLKNWVDTFLAIKPTFIGTATILSPNDYAVKVIYGPRFITYPYYLYHLDGKPYVGEYILSREEALFLNVQPPGYASSGIPLIEFDGFPLERPLGDGEQIVRLTPFSPEEILTAADISAGANAVGDTTARLIRIERKLDELLAR